MNELSIIMTVYNEKLEWLELSIESILNQTYRSFEFIIILDNPNNKEIEELLVRYSKKDKRIRLYKNKTNIGLVKSLNKALKLSNGRFIARMDADDISIEHRLETQLKYLKENPDIKLIGCNWKCIDEKNNILFEHGKLPTNYKFIKKNIKYNNMFLHPSWMFDSSILKVITEYREMTYCEDYDFITRLLSSGIKISNINQYLILYRVRNSSISISKAFEQYINSNKVIKYMDQRSKTGKDDYQDLQNGDFNDTEKKKYLEATKLFINSRECFNNKDICGFIREFILSFLKSKYRARKNLNIIIFNMKKALYKPY